VTPRYLSLSITDSVTLQLDGAREGRLQDGGRVNVPRGAGPRPGPDPHGRCV
jgi:hypothetical protein